MKLKKFMKILLTVGTLIFTIALFTACIKKGCEHDIVIQDPVAATCTEDGLTQGEYCSICNEILWYQTLIPAYGHDTLWHEGKEATCTEDGYLPYETCTMCDYSTYEKIFATGHEIYEDEGFEASCDSYGWYPFEECIKCGYSTYEEISPFGHNIVRYEYQDPTCTEDGWNAYEECTRCDYTTYNIYTKLDAYGHDTVQHAGKNATCTEDGYLPYETCTMCDYSTYEKTTALGHDIISHEGKDATAEENGWKPYETCRRCDYSTYETILATGHNAGEWIIDKEATCTEDGAKHIECADCKKVLVEEVIPAIGHDAVQYQGKTATCTEFGYEAYEACQRENCDYTTYKEINALGHNILYRDGKAVTCTEDGFKAYEFCDRCDYTTYEVLSAPGHTPSDWIIERAADCTQDGEKYIQCNTCNEILSRETVEAFGHDIVSYEGQAPTCTENGWKPYEACKRENCGYTTYEKISKRHTWENGVCKICGIDEFSEDIEYTLSEDETYYFVSGIGTSTNTDIIIASVYNNLPVSAIGADAFKNCNEITSVSIPDSIKYIGDSAFYGCYGLTNIEIPESVTEIGASAFRSTGLTSIKIPKNVTLIGSYAFADCADLDRIYYNAIDAYASDVFKNSGVSVTVGTSVVYIPDSLFWSSTMTGVTFEIGSRCRRIGESAFSSCSRLTSIEIPNSVIEIGSSAFSGCGNLTEMTLPFVGASAYATSANGSTLFGYIFGTKSYMYGAETTQYYNSSSYVKYYIPTKLNSVTVTGGEIFYGAFDNCANLTSVTISENITSIGFSAFSDCTGLTEITLPFVGANAASNTASSSTLFGYVFGNGTSQNVIGVVQNHSSSSDSSVIYYIPTSLKKVTILGGNLFYGAFSSCTRLTSIKLPESMSYIGQSAFKNCIGLTEIELPNGINSISNSLLYGCSSLKDVQIPNSVESIGVDAFYNCTDLTSITIPKSVIFIYASAFSGCVNLKDITIPESVTRIATSAFEKCVGLESITVASGNITYYSEGNCLIEIEGKVLFLGCKNSIIPNDIKSIGSSAFSGCTGLTDIIIPESVESIGSAAFSGCIGLTYIEIPNSVKSIGISAFSGCTGLTSIKLPFVGSSADASAASHTTLFGYIFGSSSYGGTIQYYSGGPGSSTHATNDIPENLKSVTVTGGKIFYGSFYNCNNLTDIIIEDNVTYIEKNAFYNCTSLVSLELPFVTTAFEGLTFNHLGYMFGANSYLDNSKYVPTSLKTVYITKGTAIPDYSFYGCSDLESVTFENDVTLIGHSAFYNCSALNNFNISESVMSIGAYAFYNCKSLDSITIPDGVISIGDSAFYLCNALKGVYINNVAVWCAIDFADGYSNPLYYARKLYLNNQLVTDLQIPYGATSIGDYAFRYYEDLISITIPNSVISIGSYAFYYCEGLNEIVFEENSKLTSIGKNAFSSCADLNSIAFPDSLIEIGEYAFFRCNGLTDISFGNGSKLNSIGASAFDSCSILKSITIPENTTSIDAYAFSRCYRLIEIINKSELVIECGSESYGYVAYYAKQVLNEVPAVSNFIENDGLLLYNANESYYLISYNGTSSNLILPDYINGKSYEIYQYAFENNTGLTSITIPNTVKSIGRHAFYNCSYLTNVSLGSSLESIDIYTFAKCIRLNNVKIPASVTSIESSAFSGCISLRNLVFEDGSQLLTIGAYAFENCIFTNITIPENVKNIEACAFHNCNSLIEINFNATSMEDLSGIVFSYDKEVGIYISVNIGANVTKIPAYLFVCSYYNRGNGRINNVNFEEGSICQSIGAYAFDNCDSLRSINIPSSIKAIGENAFRSCGLLSSVYIEDVSAWCEIDFSNECSNPLNSASHSYLYLNGNLIKELVIPSGVTAIKNYAFYNCAGLVSVKISDTVTSIGDRAFYSCDSLNSITFLDTSTWYYTSDSSYEGGTQISVDDPSANATYFKDVHFYKYYWYKE